MLSITGYSGGVQMESKARQAGIFGIICGGFGVLGCLVCLLAVAVMRAVFYRYYGSGSYQLTPEMTNFMIVFYLIGSVYYLILSVLTIMGSVFAFKRKHWGWALTGMIAGTLTLFPMGIAAVVFVTMARSEFLPARPPLIVSIDQAGQV